MATESGVPDFRSAENGIWKNQDPFKLASTGAITEHPDKFIEFYTNRIKDLQQIHPNQGHEILALWEDQGIIQSIITQNVDGLHEAAGSSRVFELHGSLAKSHCQKCRHPYNKEAFLTGNGRCTCGGMIRPSVVLFGEVLPEEAFAAAIRETEKADLFLVLGSSLSVSPANHFPVLAKENGAKLAIVNKEPTELDHTGLMYSCKTARLEKC